MWTGTAFTRDFGRSVNECSMNIGHLGPEFARLENRFAHPGNESSNYGDQDETPRTLSNALYVLNTKTFQTGERLKIFRKNQKKRLFPVEPLEVFLERGPKVEIHINR